MLLLVHHVKLRIQALIYILIFTELLILSLTPISRAYQESGTHGVRILGMIFAKAAGGPGAALGPWWGPGGKAPGKYTILSNFGLILMHYSGASK